MLKSLGGEEPTPGSVVRPWKIGARAIRFQQVINSIKGMLRSRRVAPAVALLAMGLTLTSLNAGLVADDYWHQAILRGVPRFGELAPSKLDLFRFFDGNPVRARSLMEAGVLPWWTVPEAKGHFFRPLSSLTHWLDYQLWPAAPPLMHLQSILWFGLTVFAVALLYRRIMGASAAAGLAALMWAIDDARGVPVSFLANRNAILATLLGVLALLAHDRRQREGWRWGAAAGPLLFGGALLAAEAGIGSLAYLIAYALILQPGGWRRGLKTLIPYMVILALWRVGWSALGCGVDRIELYVDPLTAPREYLGALLTRSPLLLLGQFLGPPPELTLLLGPTAQRRFTFFALGICLALGMLFARHLRRDRVARFWGAGMLLSLPPICATFPAERLLWFTGIGAFGLLAQWVSVELGSPKGAQAGGDARAPGMVGRIVAYSAGGVLLLVHMVMAALLLPAKAAHPMGSPEQMQSITDTPLFDQARPSQTVVIVNPPVALMIGYTMLIRELEGRPVAGRMRLLAPGLTPVAVERRDARTLALRPMGGYLMWPVERLVRSLRNPLRAGECVDLEGMHVEIGKLNDKGLPEEAVIRFDAPLEDPKLVWLAWRDGKFVRYTPPAPGGKETLALFTAGSPMARGYQRVLGLLCR